MEKRESSFSEKRMRICDLQTELKVNELNTGRKKFFLLLNTVIGHILCTWTAKEARYEENKACSENSGANSNEKIILSVKRSAKGKSKFYRSK